MMKVVWLFLQLGKSGYIFSWDTHLTTPFACLFVCAYYWAGGKIFAKIQLDIWPPFRLKCPPKLIQITALPTPPYSASAQRFQSIFITIHNMLYFTKEETLCNLFLSHFSNTENIPDGKYTSLSYFYRQHILHQLVTSYCKIHCKWRKKYCGGSFEKKSFKILH